jgi:hypothetical protein
LTAKSVAFVQGGKALVTATNLTGAVAYGDVPASDLAESTNNGSGVSAVVIYDTTTLQQIGEPLSLPQLDAVTVEASPDGTQVVASMGGSAVIWDLDLNHWEQLACQIAGRNLTLSEWHRYLHNQPYAVTCSQWPRGPS